MIAPETILALWFASLLVLAVLAGGLAWSVAVEGRTPGAAQVARRKLAEARGIRADRLTAYRCTQCGAWHVGHASGRGSR